MNTPRASARVCFYWALRGGGRIDCCLPLMTEMNDEDELITSAASATIAVMGIKCALSLAYSPYYPPYVYTYGYRPPTYSGYIHAGFGWTGRRWW